MCGFCNVRVCVFIVMCGCVYVWVVGGYMCRFCNVWVFVCVGILMCGCVFVCVF